MKVILLFLVTVVSALLFESCYYDKEDLLYPDEGKGPCDTSVPAKFSTDVLPLMVRSCNLSGCHSTTSAAGGVILDTYAGVKTQADNKRLMGSMNQSAGYSAMPKGSGKINSCTLTKIQQWITSGAADN
jgi:hypothetical protein